MSMTEFLAEIYNTNAASTSGEEVEKLAQAQLIDDMLKKEAGASASINDLGAYEVLKVASCLFGVDSPLAKQAAEAVNEMIAESSEEKEDAPTPLKKEEEDDDDAESEESEKEAAELRKIAEHSDMSGRIMAHAFWQEVGNLQKEAGAGNALMRALPSGMATVGKKSGLSNTAKAAIGAGVLGAGAAGAAAMRGKKDKEKQASVLDLIAQARIEVEMAKQASAQPTLEELVQQRAAELAASLGHRE